MSNRLAKEMAVLKTVFPDVEFHDDGQRLVPHSAVHRPVRGLEAD